MKLQLFINHNLFSEFDLPISEFSKLSILNFKDNVELRKRRLYGYVYAMKSTYAFEIKTANSWEIRAVAESKMYNTSEKPKSISQHETIKLIRPLAEYSNKGYLSLTGS